MSPMDIGSLQWISIIASTAAAAFLFEEANRKRVGRALYRELVRLDAGPSDAEAATGGTWLFLGIDERNESWIRAVHAERTDGQSMTVTLRAPIWQVASYRRKLGLDGVRIVEDPDGRIAEKLRIPSFPYYIVTDDEGRAIEQGFLSAATNLTPTDGGESTRQAMTGKRERADV